MNPSGFLNLLWGEHPPGAIQLWRLRDKRAIYPRSATAASAVADGQVDVYTAVSLTHPQRASDHRGRPAAKDAIAIPGVWLDIDVNGGPDQKTGAAPDRQAAVDAAHAYAAPTILVNSGYGVHAWYLFTTPWRFTSREDQSLAALLAAQWQQLHRTHFARLGWTLDATHDLARLMRLSGTLNGKATPAVPVKVMAVDDRTRYDQAVIRRLASDAGPIQTPAAAGAPGRVEIRTGGQISQVMLDLLLEDPQIAAAFHHVPARAGWSLSEYDLSIATQLAASGAFTDQQIADVLAAHRLHHGDPVKATRLDYLQRTIALARTGRQERQAA